MTVVLQYLYISVHPQSTVHIAPIEHSQEREGILRKMADDQKGKREDRNSDGVSYVAIPMYNSKKSRSRARNRKGQKDGAWNGVNH